MSESWTVVTWLEIDGRWRLVEINSKGEATVDSLPVKTGCFAQWERILYPDDVQFLLNTGTGKSYD